MAKEKEKGGEEKNLIMTDGQTNGEGSTQHLQWQVSASQPSINRGKEIAKQTQRSTAVQIPAGMGRCSRTDRQAGRGRAQTALLGAQVSQTAPSSCLERKPEHVGRPSAPLECVWGITVPSSSRTCRREAGKRGTEGDHDSGVLCCRSN